MATSTEIYSIYPPNFSEADVPEYVLPKLVSRAETLELFQDCIYGRLPTEMPQLSIEMIEKSDKALTGLAVRQQLLVRLTLGARQSQFTLLVYTPASTPKSAPVFLGLNFFGNHTLHRDPAIILPTSWCPDRPGPGVVNHRATDAGRGFFAYRWPLETILARGYGVATVFYGDIAPNDPAHVEEGVLSLFPPQAAGRAEEGRGGAMAAWAWGLSRALDVLVTLPEVDSERVAVIGHSTLGKVAVWAGAQDERFSLVISNDSGTTLLRRRFGQRLVHLNEGPWSHWYSKACHRYNEREKDLPIDQHQLIALVAPRGFYMADATPDPWRDTDGEYLALAAAAAAWGEHLPEKPADSPLVQGPLGYHLRPGEHEILEYDWERYLAFADGLWKHKENVET